MEGARVLRFSFNYSKDDCNVLPATGNGSRIKNWNHEVCKSTVYPGSREGGVSGDEKYLVFIEQLKTMNVEAFKGVTSSIYIVGLFANILLLTYIRKFKRYKSPTFALIFSLGCCDLGCCFGGCIITLIVLPILKGPSWYCPLGIYIPAAFYCCSVAHMVLFSILRFFQLVFPLAARARITVGLIARICIVLWPSTLLFTILVPTYFKSASFLYAGETLTICEYNRDVKGRQLIIESVYLLLPNTLIGTFHLVKHFTVHREDAKYASEQERQRGTRQTTDARAVTLVILVFCISSLPQLIHTYLHNVFGVAPQPYHLLIDTISLNMVFMNSALNPFIYVFCAESIRRDVFAMVTCRTTS